MPHDAKGRDLKVGDTVLVPFKIKALHQTEDYCNLDLETCATMPPEHTCKSNMSAINSKMTLRANLLDDTSFTTLNRGSFGLHIVAIAAVEDDPGPTGALSAPLGMRGRGMDANQSATQPGKELEWTVMFDLPQVPGVPSSPFVGREVAEKRLQSLIECPGSRTNIRLVYRVKAVTIPAGLWVDAETGS